jgi:hypothetical protein
MNQRAALVSKAQRGMALAIVRAMPPSEAKDHARAWVKNWWRTPLEISRFIERMTGAQDAAQA